MLMQTVLIMTSGEDIKCPGGCSCIHRPGSGTFTACIGLNLTSIPKDIPLNTEELYLKENTMGVLHQESFAGLTQLKVLVLSKCGIHSIEPNAFAGLKSLGTLDLRWNQIRELQSYTFSGLFALKRLDLDDNKLEVVHNFAFHGLNLTKLSLQKNVHLSEFATKAFYGARIHDLWIYNASISSKSTQPFRPLASSLRELHWQNNQKPLVIPENLFQGFTFRFLDLQYNGIKDTKFLKYTVADDLNLDGNPTGVIIFSRYPNLRQVRNIRLANTGFTELDGSYFSGLMNLNQLYLDDNDITTLPKNLQPIFNNLDRLVLEKNPLHCNCEMLWFRRWLYETNVIVIGAECATPQAMDVLIVPEESFECSAPSVVDITRSVNISTRDEMVLMCIVHGDPTPHIQWELPSGKTISSVPHKNQNLTMNTGILVIQSTSETDAGMYTCIATNVQGNASAVANVDVYTIVGGSTSVTPCVVVTVLLASFLTFFISQPL